MDMVPVRYLNSHTTNPAAPYMGGAAPAHDAGQCQACRRQSPKHDCSSYIPIDDMIQQLSHPVPREEPVATVFQVVKVFVVQVVKVFVLQGETCMNEFPRTDRPPVPNGLNVVSLGLNVARI